MTPAFLHAFMPRCPASKQTRWLRCLALPLLLGAVAVQASDAGNLGEVDHGPAAMAPISGITTTALDWRVSRSYGQTWQTRLALALTPQDPFADLRRGLLSKVELSGQTTLALRPRGGRIGLLLTSHW